MLLRESSISATARATASAAAPAPASAIATIACSATTSATDRAAPAALATARIAACAPLALVLALPGERVGADVAKRCFHRVGLIRARSADLPVAPVIPAPGCLLSWNIAASLPEPRAR